jgi:hypothetical protein
MSGNTFPFAAVQDEAGAASDEAHRRPLAVALGGGLLAVALVGGAVFAFTGGDDVPVEGGASSVVRAPAAAPAAAAEQPQAVPVANTEEIARNPFEPKYVAPAPPTVVEAPAAALAGGAGGVPPQLVVTDAQGRLVSVPTGQPAGSPAQPLEPAPAAPAPAPREYRLVLTGVTTDGDVPTAQFTIDGAVSSVRPTEVFGPQRQLLLRSLQQGPKDGQWTATIQVGDARPIDVVTGEAVFVQ